MRVVAENRDKIRALEISTIAISSVVFVEVTLGLLVGSLAILSDGIHALLDTLTTFALFFATRASLRPADEEHMYGHEKFESIGGLVGGIALVGVAVLVLYEAVLRIIRNTAYLRTEYDLVGFAAIGYTFCVDFFRVGIFRKALNTESSTVKAGLYHAVADLASTVIAFAGFGLAAIGIYLGDPIASVVLSLTLSFLSVRLVWSSAMELSDTISKDVVEKIRREMHSIEGIGSYEGLRIRKAGAKTFVEATLKIPEYVGLEQAHELASDIERKIKKSVGNAEVTIHVEPSETEAETKKLVEGSALQVKGVREAHEIESTYAEGKLYITLHAQIDAKTPMDQAHEIAGKIETQISKSIANIENITVHMEPFNAKLRKGTAAYEADLQRIVSNAATACEQPFRVKRIVTYVTGKKRYVNIDCTFSKEISMEKAHEVTSKIEGSIKENYAETVVTVHMETE